MKRNAFNDLIEWKNSKNRKPLIIQGARQVGKTWLMQAFGKAHYIYTAYVSFNDNADAKTIFEATYNIDNIILGLSVLTNTKITPGETLIILDEIQESERALNVLKFFNENAPQYHIMAAGSLLGVALRQKKMSFPVGQVAFLTIYPLCFSEFLNAVGFNQLVDLMQGENKAILPIAHEKYVYLLKQYMFIGGMPEAVKSFVKEADFNKVRKIQNQILAGYQKDFSKYTESHNIPKINAIWNSIPAQFAKENKKFTFSSIAKSARAREYEDALEWLVLCGLVYKVHNVSKPELPLIAYQEFSAFKIYMIDVGLLCAKANVEAKVILNPDALFNQFKGALTEQYVYQSLKIHDNLPINYWTNGPRAEIDFLIQFASTIIPIEVKSSTNLKSKSLTIYRDKYTPKKSIKTSLATFEENQGLYNIPLYLIENFKDFI